MIYDFSFTGLKDGRRKPDANVAGSVQLFCSNKLGDDMLEKPHMLFQRDEATKEVEAHYSAQLTLLEDLANYGSNLVIRSFNSSSKGMAEIIVCKVLLRQVVSMVDAVLVLLQHGCGHAAFLPARTAYEASVYLDYMLAADTELRAKRFLVGNYRDERLWSAMVTPGTPESTALAKLTSGLKFDIHATRPELAAAAPKQLAEVNRILNQPELKPIDDEFTKARGNKKYDVSWYGLDGLRSIKQLADSVSRGLEYEFFYSKGSQIAHTGSYKDYIRFVGGKVHLKPIRHLADIKYLLDFTVNTALTSYKRVIIQYRPTEIVAFNKKYLDDWRSAFLSTPIAKYEF